MSALVRIVVVTGMLVMVSPAAARADCASDCQASYHDCLRGGNADSCLGAQGVCLNRCTLGATRERHGAIAYSSRKEVYDDCRVLVTFHNACGALALGDRGTYGSAWGLSQREASTKAMSECRPHGGASCKIQREVCSGARR